MFNLRILDFESIEEFTKFNQKYIKPSDYGAGYMAEKAGAYCICAENLRVPAVRILKEAMLSVGGEAVTPSEVLIKSEGLWPVVITANYPQLKRIIRRLKLQQFGLPRFADELKELLENIIGSSAKREIPCRYGSLPFDRKTLVMGVLNCTPDSFSDGGKWLDVDAAVAHGLEMEAAGADLIDIGGESTRPGSEPVSGKEEQERIIPVISRLSQRLKIPISVDTYKAETAEKAVAAGASVINDIWGFQYDNGEMAEVAAKAQCPVILMHNKNQAEYTDLMGEITAFFYRSIDIALNAGCKKENLILDPGFGFGKNHRHNLYLTKKFREFTGFGCPLLMAASRKRTIGEILDAPVDKRIMGDAALAAVAAAKGAGMLRVHDVAEIAQVLKVTDAIRLATDDLEIK